MAAEVAPRILLLLGAGFLIANLRIALEALKFFRRRSSAVLTWRGQKPSYYGLQLGLGVVLGFLLIYDVLVVYRTQILIEHDVPPQLFGIVMMFLYYGYLMPLSVRIGRGFYADGI